MKENDGLEASESVLNTRLANPGLNNLGLSGNQPLNAIIEIGTRFDSYGNSGYGVTSPQSGYGYSDYGDSYGYSDSGATHDGSYGGYGKRPNNVKINLGGNLKIRNPIPSRPLRFRFNTMFPGISELKFRIPGINLALGGITEIDICPDILLAALVAAAAAAFYAFYVAITMKGRRRERDLDKEG